MKINKNITPHNRWEGRFGDSVGWIVMHYTGNPCAGGPDTAKGEAQYFADGYRGSSAHFFVDQREIWQSVEIQDTAWHCGDAASKNGCHNTNSIGIEMCVLYEGGVYSIPEKTTDLAAELARYLLTLYPDARICRHFDVTGKICPEPWVRDPGAFEKFLEKVGDGGTEEKIKKQLDSLTRRVKTLEQQVRAGEEYDRFLSRDIARIDGRTAILWDGAGECPEWLRPTVEKLVSRGYLAGDGNGGLGLTYDLARALVVCDRGGLFG